MATVTALGKGDIALIEIGNPPVNAINSSMRVALAAALDEIEANPAIKAVLLTTPGHVFMAGVDITEFVGPVSGPTLQSLEARLETFRLPIVVAIQGLALGGGLELAMACHFRIAHRDAKMGLPELTLGLIPGAGGTQRLPRLIGVRNALDMILSGAPISAATAKANGLIDEVADADLRAKALSFCEALVHGGVGPRPTRDRMVADTLDQRAITEVSHANARVIKGLTVPGLVVEALKASSLRFDDGMKEEARLAEQSLAARESHALRHLFFAERAAGKIPGAVGGRDLPPVQSAAVIGAGTMGSGIALAFADAGLRVTLIDSSGAALQRGLDVIRANYATSVKRGRIDQSTADLRVSHIVGSTKLEDVGSADVIIEAVFEDLAIKKTLLRALDALVPPDRLIASNTSTLSVTELARSTAHPSRVVGLHFFSPAHVMKLLEIVRAADTTPQIIATSLQVSRLLKKIGVVASDGFGFIGNRMMLDGYFREAEQLMLEGASPREVDVALESFGFAMGPQRVSDLGGTDVGTKARIQLYKRESRPDPYFVIADRLTDMGRLGQKSGTGFYRYLASSRDALDDPAVDSVILDLASQRGIVRRTIAAEEIVERCVLSLIHFGAVVLEEGIATRAADIDVVWTNGYGFPRYRGGPMFYADTLGLTHVASRIHHYHNLYGHYWKPTGLLERLASETKTFQQWDKERSSG